MHKKTSKFKIKKKRLQISIKILKHKEENVFCHPPNSPAGAGCSACSLNAAFDVASSDSFGRMPCHNHTHESSACRNHLDDVGYVAVDHAWTRILCCS